MTATSNNTTTSSMPVEEWEDYTDGEDDDTTNMADDGLDE